MLKLEITIPEEFVDNYFTDKFDDALHRLSADAHLLAGNYEQETAEMLSKALKEAEPVYIKPMCEVCENLEDGDDLYQRVDLDDIFAFECLWDIHYCPKCGRRLAHEL